MQITQGGETNPSELSRECRAFVADQCSVLLGAYVWGADPQIREQWLDTLNDFELASFYLQLMKETPPPSLLQTLQGDPDED